MTIDIIKCSEESKEDLDEMHKFLHEIFCEFDEYHEYRQTILELAVERNYVEVVQLILDLQNSADPWNDDFISLMPLIYKAKDMDYKNMVKVLTEKYEAGAQSSIFDIKDQARLISAIGMRQTGRKLVFIQNYTKNIYKVKVK